MEDQEKGYLTVTTFRPPSSASLYDSSKFPFGCIVKPFIQNESNVPVVSFPTKELVRCSQCQGYICPYSEFVEAGAKWVCNLCKTINVVPGEYFATIDAQGKRTDLDKRIELKNLTIDLVAPESYMSRPPMPCIYVLIIDLSIKAQENEYISLIVSTIKDVITAQAFPGHPRTEIALLFFDKSVHFVSIGAETPVFYTETELNDLFLPVPTEQLLVTIDEVEEKLLQVLEISKNLISLPYSTCYLAALRAAGLILQAQGGKIISFCGEMFTDTTHPLQFSFKPTTSVFQDLGKEFSQWNISCTQFIRTSQYCNLQSLIDISRYSSGQIFFYPHFNHKLSGEKLRNEVIMAITGLTAWECSLKVRVSHEWTIREKYGNFVEKAHGLLGIPVYNSPQCFAFEISPNSFSYQEFYIQTAMLYTSIDGERKLRIHNLKLKTTENLKDIYENANCEALISMLARKALQEMMLTDKAETGGVYLEARCKEIVQSCCKIWGKQPTSLEFFCASVLGLLKQYAFMNKSYGCKSYLDNLNLDIFHYFKFMYESLGSEATGILSYPRLYPVHEDFSTVLNLTHRSLDTKGAYLLDTGVELLFWIGKLYIWI